MNHNFEIVWTQVAENDLREIIEYISADSNVKARNVLKKIKQYALNLYTFPEKGRIVPELQDQGIFQYRELVIPPWRLMYRIDEQIFYVLSVIDSRRNVEDVLLARFMATASTPIL